MNTVNFHLRNINFHGINLYFRRILCLFSWRLRVLKIQSKKLFNLTELFSSTKTIDGRVHYTSLWMYFCFDLSELRATHARWLAMTNGCTRCLAQNKEVPRIYRHCLLHRVRPCHTVPTSEYNTEYGPVTTTRYQMNYEEWLITTFRQ